MKNILFIFALIFISGSVKSQSLSQVLLPQTQINLNAVIKNALDTHNAFRAKHKAPPLVLDPAMSNISQAFANTLAASGKMYHSSNKYQGMQMGENIYKCWGCVPNGKDFTTSWYNEVTKYNFDKPGYSSETGHFTQIVWKSSKKLGLGVAAGPNKTYVVVANYFPAGNMLSSFSANVLK